MRHPGPLAGSPYILDNTQAGGSRINLQKPQILRDDEMGLSLSKPPAPAFLTKAQFASIINMLN